MDEHKKTYKRTLKSAASVGSECTPVLSRIAAPCGSDFQAGIVLYNGTDILPIGTTPFLAVPFKKLWEL